MIESEIDIDKHAQQRRDRERRLDLRLDDTLAAPGSAREAVAAWLTAASLDGGRRSDVLLVVSELVTNAVTHAQSAPQLLLVLEGERLRVEVRDWSRRRPRPRRAGNASGGFGLRLVAQVTDRWGWSNQADGKVVWAEFALTT